jgi:hypothetical protein
MAKSSIPPFDQENQRVFQGVNGKVTARVGVSKRNRPKKDGGVKQVQRYVSLETVDGCYWHPGDQTRLVVCECCRRGDAGWFRRREIPNHGLCTAEAAVRCQAGCGAWVCPAHVRQIDGRWVCRDCARRGLLGRVLRAIFCERVEDSE